MTIKQGKARRIADRCEFLDDDRCPLCYYKGDDDPVSCCAYCVKLPDCNDGEICEFISGKKEVSNEGKSPH